MGHDGKRLRTFWWTAALFAMASIAFALWVGLQVGGPRTTDVVDDLGELLTPLLAAAACGTAAAKLYRSRAAWSLLAVSSASWAAGEAVWCYYDLLRGTLVPFPSLADAGYLGAVPFALAGLLSFPGVAHRAFSRLRQLLDATMIAGSLLFASWALVLGPTLRQAQGGLLKQVLAVAYPASDVALVSLALIVALGASQRDRASLGFVVVGIIGFAIADSGFAYFTVAGTFGIGNVLDAGWFSGYLLVALGALYELHSGSAPPREDAPDRVTLASLLAPYAIVGLAAAVALGRLISGGSFGLFLPVEGMALAIALCVRQVLHLVDNVNLNRRLVVKVEVGNRELAESEERFRSIFDQAPIGIFRIGPDDRIIDANQALCHLAGRSREELHGSLRSALFDERPAVGPVGEPGGKGGALASQRRVRRPDGTMRMVQVNDVVVRDKQGALHALIATVEDVTEQLRLAEDLQRAQQMEALGQLAGGIAHEINTPVQFISDNLAFLANMWRPISELLVAARGAATSLHQGEPPREVAKLLERYCQAADIEFVQVEVPTALTESQEGLVRVATIVRAMKAFGRPDCDQPEQTDIDLLVANAITVARNELKHVADLTSDLTAAAEISCFPGAISQVVLNLLVNAAYAVGESVRGSGGRGHIGVRAWSDGPEVCISVADSGPGIPDDVLPRIFQPFFTTKPFGRGTGQGLAMAWSTVVDQHGGQINVATSTAGTTFTVRLPLNRAGAPCPPLAGAGALTMAP
jgi:PAS domain S-box-containing protein